MIKTGLPYSIDKITEISTNGAIVDMSSLNFPSIKGQDQVKTSLIFLRNTGFDNVVLDFSNCSYELKEEFIKEYLTTDIKVKNEELSDAVMSIIDYKFFHNASIIESFMDVDECKTFLKRNKTLMDELLQLLASIPIYSLYRLQLNNVAYDLSDIKHAQQTQLGLNYMHLLKYKEMQSIMFNTGFEPMFYDKFFTSENNELFDCIGNSGLGIAETLLGFEKQKPEDFTKALKGIDDAIETFVSKKEKQQ